VQVERHDKINSSIKNNISYICAETLAVSLELVDKINSPVFTEIELIDDINTRMHISKV
jgi:hypothetical protein